MKVTTIGIDLAKNVFQIHGIDQHGKAVLKKQLKRAQMAPFLSTDPHASLGWRLMAAHITGRASCKQWATPCV